MIRELTPNQPAWEIATLYPPQGAWSVDDYLALDTNQLIEFTNGQIVVLPMPSQRHQDIVGYLYLLLLSYIRNSRLGGKVNFAPLRVRVAPNKFREPDLIYMLPENAHRRHNEFWEGADLVVEVISPDNPSRDTKHKRREYERARIPEYWIIDERNHSITILSLVNRQYVLHGHFFEGAMAESILLPDFAVDVTNLFEQLE